MIKDIFKLLGNFIKLIGKILHFFLKYIGKYLSNINEIIKDRPKKTNNKIEWNEEIL